MTQDLKTGYPKLIILLVDQEITYSDLNTCISTNTTTSIISFGHNFLNVTRGVHICIYVVTNLESAVRAVWNSYM